MIICLIFKEIKNHDTPLETTLNQYLLANYVQIYFLQGLKSHDFFHLFFLNFLEK